MIMRRTSCPAWLLSHRSGWRCKLHPQRVQLFLLFYYILTGLHGLHMVIGMGILTVLLISGLARPLLAGVFRAGGSRRPVLAFRRYYLDIFAATSVLNWDVTYERLPLTCLFSGFRRADRADAHDGWLIDAFAGRLAYPGGPFHRHDQGAAGGACLHALAQGQQIDMDRCAERHVLAVHFNGAEFERFFDPPLVARRGD